MWSLFRSGRRARKLSSALQRLMDRKELERLMRATPDRRHLIEVVAHALGKSEIAVIQAVADHCGCAVLERPLPTDLEIVVERAGGFTLADFRRVGVIPVTNETSIVGIVCVDPEVLDVLPAELQQLPLAMAPWEGIARALYESEKRMQDKEELRAQEEARALEAATQTVLSALIEEADSFVSPELQVSFHDQTVQYSFMTSDGRRAIGEVNAVVRQSLHSLLLALSKGAHPAGIRFPASWQQGLFQVVHDTLTDSFVIANRRREVAPQTVLRPSEHSGKVVPFPVNNAALRQEGEQKVETLSSEKPLILIVDDNPTFARVLERFFSRNEATTVHAESGARALEMIVEQQVKPQLIVCDVHMPLMNGVEFLKQLREKAFQIPTIMLTSDADVEIEIELLGAGADAYVRKQDDPRLLWVHVKRLLQQRRAA